MKYIKKQQPPHELIAWTKAESLDLDGQPMDWSYADMESPVRQAVKVSLLQEQGGLCCYTGRRITFQSSHIEHLKPQSLCEGHEDTDYANLLAAFPAPNTSQCKYGAHARGNWFDERLFVHPLRRDCELRFRYTKNGKVAPANPEDAGAKETIHQLRLNKKELRTMREQAIHELLFVPRLSKSQVQRLMTAMDERDSNGFFTHFCFVIKQVCEKYLKRLD